MFFYAVSQSVIMGIRTTPFPLPGVLIGVGTRVQPREFVPFRPSPHFLSLSALQRATGTYERSFALLPDVARSQG
jgi:hypothetical protein